jgi:hypothetical protein
VSRYKNYVAVEIPDLGKELSLMNVQIGAADAASLDLDLEDRIALVSNQPRHGLEMLPKHRSRAKMAPESQQCQTFRAPRIY